MRLREVCRLCSWVEARFCPKTGLSRALCMFSRICTAIFQNIQKRQTKKTHTFDISTPKSCVQRITLKDRECKKKKNYRNKLLSSCLQFIVMCFGPPFYRMKLIMLISAGLFYHSPLRSVVGFYKANKCNVFCLFLPLNTS